MLLSSKLKTNIQKFITNVNEYSPSLRCIQSEFPWIHHPSSKFLFLQITKLGGFVQKPVNANPGLEVNQSFSSSLNLYKNIFNFLCFEYFKINQAQN